MDSQDGKLIDYFSVSFRIMGTDLDPSAITTLLGIEPDIKHKKGDPRTGKTKNGKIIYYAPYDSGLWCIESKLDKHSRIQEHIESIMELITPKKDVIAKLQNGKLKMDFYCGYFFSVGSQPGFGISAEVLKCISELGIDFGVSLYPWNN